MREKILAFVTIDDLQPELRELAERVGINPVRSMLMDMEGTRMQFRLYSTQASVRRRYVVANYRLRDDGSDNVMALARDLGVTPRTVRRYLQNPDDR